MSRPGGLQRGSRRIRRNVAVALRPRLSRLLPRSLHLLPEFLIIGAQRSGTTSLYRYLTSHPRVLPAAVKEIHYFDLAFERSLWWYGTFFPSRLCRAVRSAGGMSTPIAGECTPYYLFHPHVPARVRRALPTVRLVAILRDPAERAYSHYRHEVEAGREWLSFGAALEAETTRTAEETVRLDATPSYRSEAHQRFSYVARGRYAEQIARWLEWFPREQLLVVSAEQLYSDPQTALEPVYRHLGLEPGPSFDARIHNRSRGEGGEEASMERLRDYFRPYNRRLYDLVGTDFGWPA